MKYSSALRPYLFAALFALPAMAQKAPDVRLNVGTTAGAGQAIAPKIAAAGDRVYVVWQDARLGFTWDIYCNRSLDAGATWLGSDVRLDVGTAPGSSGSYLPQIAASGAAVYVVWEDGRNAPGFDIFFNRSLDAGTTWLGNDVRLDTGSATPAHSTAAQIAASGTSVYVVWTDFRNGSGGDVYFNRSTDSGATWLPAAVRLDTGSAPGTSDSWGPCITAVGAQVFVAWVDARNAATNGDVYFNRSLDGGLTWLPSDTRIDLGGAPGAHDSSSPQIAASANGVFVTWYEFRSGAPGVYFNRSLDGGMTWPGNDQQLGLPTAAAVSPCLAVDGASVTVAWYDYRNGNFADIYSNSSPDGGTTWLPNDVRLDTGSAPAVHASWNPRIAAAGSLVYAIWDEHRGTQTSRVYANRSLDGGITWLASDVRLDGNNGPGVGGTVAPEVCASGSNVFVVWNDQRHPGADNIYFALATGHQPYGVGTPGTNAITPVLAGRGLAAVGGVVALEFTSGLGGAPGLLVIGLGPAAQIAQPLVGGTLLVQPAATLFFLLGGATGVPGAGSHVHVLPVPTSLGVLGLNLDYQGLFLDGGAVQGVSMSNAVASWIG